MIPSKAVEKAVTQALEETWITLNEDGTAHYRREHKEAALETALIGILMRLIQLGVETKQIVQKAREIGLQIPPEITHFENLPPPSKSVNGHWLVAAIHQTAEDVLIFFEKGGLTRAVTAVTSEEVTPMALLLVATYGQLGTSVLMKLDLLWQPFKRKISNTIWEKITNPAWANEIGKAIRV